MTVTVRYNRYGPVPTAYNAPRSVAVVAHHPPSSPFIAAGFAGSRTVSVLSLGSYPHFVIQNLRGSVFCASEGNVTFFLVKIHLAELSEALCTPP